LQPAAKRRELIENASSRDIEIACPPVTRAFSRSMTFRWAISALRYFAALGSFLIAFPCSAQQKVSGTTQKSAETWAQEPMVDLAIGCPAIRIELRYASQRNLIGKLIYPANARCFVHQSVAERLQRAQDELHRKGFGLKIWDAYRPDWAQKILWHAVPNPDFLQPPGQAPSMHTHGVAVDVTLVTADGKELRMPSDFDDFSVAASMHYAGDDPVVARHLRILQIAMGHAGFLGMHTEWWHFVARDFENSKPVDLDIRPRGATP
jgi:zinc D-Ala-D-Ala dipeptidase